MTNSERIVLENMGHPDGQGVSGAIITQRCWREEVNEATTWPIIEDLIDRGLVAEFTENRGAGQMSYYKLTLSGAEVLEAVPA